MKIYSENEIGNVASEIIARARLAKRALPDRATLITFSGNLGAGKTTMIQEIARQLGIAENLQSPTYVIYKKYPLGLRPLPLKGGDTSIGSPWKFLIHGDMYRLESSDEILKLGWENLLQDPENLILIEWPEKITDVIPKDAIAVSLTHEGELLRGIDF